jgi:triacylglycerol esterase/lipase EstA (alpha/beta hydrolase family)
MKFACILTALALLSWTAAAGQETGSPEAQRRDSLPWNAELATFGGKQFWSDERVHHDWRIQRNVMSGHYRLLDDENVRRAWGSFEQCHAEFLRLKQELDLPPLRPRVVIVLHGLLRSRESMEDLCAYLRQHGDFSVLNVSYASSRGKLAEHAAALAKVIDGLEGVDEINFVGHSLGNLVIRHYFGDAASGLQDGPPRNRIGRIVMLAPPNQGALMAQRFRNNPVFHVVWGTAGQELADDWSRLENRLAVPDCQFGVIAGGKGDAGGSNPLLPGDDDFVVSIDETRLGGAHDFIVVPTLHSSIMNDHLVQGRTLRFLQHGFFVSEESRQPIAPAPPP